MNAIRPWKMLNAGLICIVMFLLGPDPGVKAQGLIPTMLEQVARLELCLQEAKQGYSIVQKGLSTIGEFKKGAFDLHSLFFGSLLEVKPAIKGYAKVADILILQKQIVQGGISTLQACRATGMFTASDLTYLSAVCSNLTDLTREDLEELEGLITDGRLQMTDDQRLSRIDQLYSKVRDKYSFLLAFSNRVHQEARLRQQEKQNLTHLSQIGQP